MATAGGLVFVLTREGAILWRSDARTGKHLWHFLTGTNPAAAPMSYGGGWPAA